jgi:protein involved in polysaccharide export with SLBB domain
MPTLSTATLAALQSSIKPTGSTRRITLVRGKDRKTVDLYKMSITGDVSGDIPLQPGDSVYIPPVTDYVEIDGEITRPGKYEMFAVTGGSGSFTVRDLVELSLGLTPSAAKDKAYIERIGDDGLKKLVNLDLRDMAKGKDANLALQPGDKLVIPTISIYQPIIRLIGEFKGEGVYQRATGMSTLEVQNKSGIYFIKQGQTVLDIISATGGVTPQADLTRGHIERTENGVQRIIPIDLERLMVKGDKTADIALQNGDSIVLPAVADKIHVFGEVKSPGSFVYSPNRRLVDYIGDAGGPTSLAKLTLVSVVRVTNGKPDVRKYNAQNAMRGNSAQDNPVLEPGDIVYITPKFVSDWRDAVQLVFTAFSLRALFR